eukprot:2996974-Rhodomonas_salina.1
MAPFHVRPGTDLACAASGYARATRCPAESAYAMLRGTDVGDAATRVEKEMPELVTENGGTGLRPFMEAALPLTAAVLRLMTAVLPFMGDIRLRAAVYGGAAAVNGGGADALVGAAVGTITWVDPEDADGDGVTGDICE